MVYQRLFYQRSYKEITSQLFVCPKTVYRMIIYTFLNSGDVKPYRLGRPILEARVYSIMKSLSIMDCILRTTRIRLHEIANYITSATSSSFRPQTLCHAVHMLGMTRKNVGHWTDWSIDIGWLLTKFFYRQCS